MRVGSTGATVGMKETCRAVVPPQVLVLPLLVVGAASAETPAALGLFDTGVERDWWEGPTSFTGSGLDMSNLSGADLFRRRPADHQRW